MATNIKNTVPFNYDEIYQDIVTRFAELGYDSPYDGSNIANLSSILAYTLSSFNFNTAVNINENILHLARKRDNVLEDARVLSYEATNAVSAQIKLTLEFIISGIHTIKKYTTFQSGGYTFTYMGDDITKVVKEKGETIELILKEGNQYLASKNNSLNFILNTESDYIDIPFQDVEEDGLEVFVSYSKNGINKRNEQFFKKSSNLIDLNDDFENSYIRKDVIETGTCRIYFKYNDLGKPLPRNSRITVNCLTSSGEIDVDQLQSFSNPLNFCRIDLIKYPLEILSTGQNKESIENIKEIAPLFYNTVGRGVTKDDYIALTRKHTSVKHSEMWGGEDDFPLRKGELYFSFVPQRKLKSLQNYNKSKSDNTFFYAKNYSDNLDYQYNFLENYLDKVYNFSLDGEIVSPVAKNGKILDKGIIDLVKEKYLPALDLFIKNPSYIETDLNVNVLRYPNGLSKSDVRKMLIDEINEYFKCQGGFKKEFIKSDLINRLSDKLGVSNAIEINPNFSVNLNEKNRTLQVVEVKNFRTNNIFYNTNYANKKLTISLEIPPLSEAGDILRFKLNKNVLVDGVLQDFFEYELVERDIKSQNVRIVINDVNDERSEISVKIDKLNGETEIGRNIDLYNFKNKKLFYYTRSNKELSELKIYLGHFCSIGDKIEIFGFYKSNRELLHSHILNQNDIVNGFYIFTDHKRAEFAGVVGADNYELIFTSQNAEAGTKIDNLYQNQILGENKLTDYEAKSENDKQNNVFYNFELDGLYYQIKNDGINQYALIWIANAQPNEIVTITKNGIDTTIVLNQEMIFNQYIEVKINDLDLEISEIEYTGDTSIKVYHMSVDKLFQLAEVENDDLRYVNEKNKFYNDYQPIADNLGDPRIKTTELLAFTNSENRFDVRNLIFNYAKDLGDITVELADKEYLSFEWPYIYVKDVRSPEHTYFTLNYKTSKNVYLSEQISIFVKELSFDLYDKEGHGGVYVYLDMPLEGIYTSDGKLIVENLPKFSLVKNSVYGDLAALSDFKSKKVFTAQYNDDIWDLNKQSFLRNNSVVEPDFNIQDEDIANSLLPYSATVEEVKNANLSKISFIKFPIKDGNKIVGSYTIYNSRIPYIKIKFLNNFINSNKEFLLKYPTDNFKMIKNTSLRLRSIVFDDYIENQPQRDYYIKYLNDEL